MTFYVFCYVFLFSQVNTSRGTKVGHIDQEFTKSVFGVKQSLSSKPKHNGAAPGNVMI